MFKHLLISLIILSSTSLCFAQNSDSDIEKILSPLRLDTPRDTMRSFMQAMTAYKKGVETGQPQLIDQIDQAARTFNLSETPFVLRQEVGKEIAIFLKEVIDRVIVIDYSLIPDDPEVSSWRLKNTDINIVKVTEGEQKGLFLFSASTAYRAKEFYQKVKHLEYLKGSGLGALYKPPWYKKYIPIWAKNQTFLLPNWQWVILFLSIFVGLLLKKSTKFILRFILKFTNRDMLRWQNKSLAAIERPSGTIVASAFWLFALYIFQFEGRTLSILTVAVQVIFSISIVWACYRLTDVFSEFIQEVADKTSTPLDDHLVPLASKSMRIFVIIFGSLITFQGLGFNVMSVLAGLGLGGLAFALAAKDACANLFGSIMILLDRPFAIGDWIVAGDVEGTVEEIGFRSTRIRTFYSSSISVPNSSLANANIDNMGVRHYRRMKADLGITYDTPPDKVEAFTEGIKNIIRANPYTRKDYFHVCFTQYGDFSLNIMVYLFLTSKDWSDELKEKQNLLLEILRLAKKLGVEFAFPTQTLHMVKE